jgi:hypothetical protein
MERFKNSLYIAFYAAIINSVAGFVFFIVLIYPKDPLKMPDAMIGLLTVTPFIVFFMASLVTLPMVVIPVKKQNFLQKKLTLNGFYELLLYVVCCTLLVALFDFVYQTILGNEFSQKFALALKSTLKNSKEIFSEEDYKSFADLPFLIQNMLTFILGILAGGITAYLFSIAISKRLIKKY